jgi:diaminopimelate epimerase
VNVSFVKMSGAGNDMILVDHRDRALAGREEEFSRHACHRRQGAGADGVILLEEDDSSDFRVRFFNPDGGEYALCGNGARCVPLFAAEIGIPGPVYRFRSASGAHVGEMVDEGTGRIELPGVREIRLDVETELDGKPAHLDWGDIGVPHAAFWVDTAEAVQIDSWGPQLRNTTAFAPNGTNVSFVERLAPGEFRMRTFERGVEGETWACGSGSAVVATIAQERGWADRTAAIHVRGGCLTVELPPEQGAPIALLGPVTRCYEGILRLPTP